MISGGSSLGICYADNHLYYAANAPGQDSHLARIGCIDFSFNVEQVILSGSEAEFPVLKKSLEELKIEHSLSTIKILLPATKECWAAVPRSAYEVASEREAHIQLLMRESDRSSIQVTWHSLSKKDSRLLIMRDQSGMQGFNHLLSSFGSMDIISEFEIASLWHVHTDNNGAFIMVNCQQNYISIASFVLGKLRSCTYFEYEHLSDISYLWNLYATSMPWLSGIHDNIFVYGYSAKHVAEQLSPFWRDHGELSYLDSLETMNVDAQEKTYGFQLESAFPAILMSLNH